MRKIFCLETEWVQSIHSLKSRPSALSLLDFLQNSDKRISFLFRNVASFANGDGINIMDFARENQGIFEGKNVHFGCCSTLNIGEDETKEFKRLTKARMITGYKKDVPFIESFVFELWLLNVLLNHPGYGAIRLMDIAEKEMGYYTRKFKFEAF